MTLAVDQPPAVVRPASSSPWLALLRNPNAIIGLLIIIAIVAMAALASVFYPTDPMNMVARPFLWPGQDARFPLGTDSLGRDLTAGILHGARASLFVGIAATVIGVAIGLVIGAIAGYLGGYVDDILVRVIELFQTIPNFLFVLVLVAIARPSVTTIAIGIGVTSWPIIARLTRAEFRALREREFVAAARSMGISTTRVIFGEILPNALPPVVVTSSVVLASAILNESALAFLGLGDANIVSWGSLIGEGREHLRTAWYLAAVPGVFLVLTILAINLLGEALNDAFNPRLSDRG
jgi:peptide/nickel transport system permease protein